MVKAQYFLLLSILMFTSCKDPVSNTSPITATEKWYFVVPQTESHADMTLNKHENDKISVSGNWKYDFYGNEITCNIMSGSAVKDTTHLVFNCSGTASYPPDSAGDIESSPFNLTMDGSFQNGHSSGNWQITFSDELWNEWAPEGVFTGQRETGSGVTD